jgi:PAS domain S-box-containing protein
MGLDTLVTPRKPPSSDHDADNARLRDQVAALTARAARLESCHQALLDEQAARIEAEVAKRNQALSKSEAMLAESQRLAQIGSFELDVATRRLQWSAQQFRNFGLLPAPAVDRELVVARIHPDDRARHEAAVARAIAAGEDFAIDYRVVHPDGRVRRLHTIARPVFNAAGHVVKLVGTSQDITERSALEDRLRAQYEQLMKLDELKSNFVDSVTHELRTPLTSIMGYAEFLEDGVGGPTSPMQQKFIGQIQRGARRLEYLLNDLIDFARIEAGTFTLKLEPGELGGRVREALESLRPQADEAQLSLVAALPDAPLALEMDAQRIGQVLTKLAANAIKFSPRGGTVTITASVRAERIRCEVTDAGPGIAHEDLPRLFQRFSQLEAGVSMGKGAGLGLSISKALVEAHGGAIGVESTPGEGSTFWFELPVAPPQA